MTYVCDICNTPKPRKAMAVLNRISRVCIACDSVGVDVFHPDFVEVEEPGEASAFAHLFVRQVNPEAANNIRD